MDDYLKQSNLPGDSGRSADACDRGKSSMFQRSAAAGI